VLRKTCCDPDPSILGVWPIYTGKGSDAGDIDYIRLLLVVEPNQLAHAIPEQPSIAEKV
jgi:hypothetical protein